jgi:hypothetical protein
LIDLVSNQTGFFLKDWQSCAEQDFAARKILVIGTGSGSDLISASMRQDARVERINISEFGSLHGLAGAILAQA